MTTTPSPRRAVPLALLLLAACTVGPDFERPPPATTPGYTGKPVTLPAAGSAAPVQRLAPGTAVEGEWWHRFNAPALDDAVALALKQSPSLDTARATLAQARESVIAAQGALYPQLDLAAGASRVSPGPAAANVVYNLFSIGPLVSFDLDPFGRLTRQVEQQAALAELQRYQLAAAYLTLTGDVVTEAVSIAAARAQIAAAERIIAIDQRNLELVRISYEAGHAAETDVLSAESQLEADRTLLPPLQQQLSVARHALAVLVGEAPSDWHAPDFDTASLRLPQDLPVTLPSALVRERPDILAAEAQLHADSAAIGVATAELYPDLTLSASFAAESLKLGGLFNSPTSAWSVASALTAPLFHGGTLEAQRRATIDAYAAQLGLYRTTVLQAFGQIADVLRALQHDADLLGAEERALIAARASFELAQESYQAGMASFLQVLDAERLYAQAQLGYAKAESQRYLDTIQLFTAMGGGWREWNEPALR